MKYLYIIGLFILYFGFFASCKSANTVVYEVEEKQSVLMPIQKKYSKIMGLAPEQVKPIILYEFIDSWIGTPYKLGGETKKGIDCSYFSQSLFHEVYGELIERTAQKQFMAANTDRFIGQEFLKQGDLLFFNPEGSYYQSITHVGVYLGNGRFVHSSSSRTSNGKNGVQISNFKEPKWQKMFVAAGRKVLTSKRTISGSN